MTVLSHFEDWEYSEVELLLSLVRTATVSRLLFWCVLFAR